MHLRCMCTGFGEAERCFSSRKTASRGREQNIRRNILICDRKPSQKDVVIKRALIITRTSSQKRNKKELPRIHHAGFFLLSSRGRPYNVPAVPRAFSVRFHNVNVYRHYYSTNFKQGKTIPEGLQERRQTIVE